MNKRTFSSLLVCLALGACASAQVSSVPVAQRALPKVSVIAITPGGGLLADAVGIELSNRNYTVVEANSTSTMMTRLGITEVEMAQGAGMEKLRTQGVDAVLSVKAVGGPDGLPSSASARLTSTVDGKLMAGVTWQNGWGGHPGSPADRTMRKGLVEAASQITDALAQRLGH